MPGRNIANIPVLDEFIAKVVEASRPEKVVADWLRVKFKRYMINEYDDVSEVREPVPDDYPGHVWINAALERKERLYNLELIGTEDIQCMYDWMTHVVDYMNYVVRNGRELPPRFRFRDVMRLSVEDALNKADAWSDWFQGSAELQEDLKGLDLIMVLPDDYRWVRIKSEAALMREGRLMHHCVGSYYRSIANGSSQIYSLRDEENEPHVTVEARGRSVSQIKGKQNRAPIEKYQWSVRDLLNRLKLDVEGCYDARQCGFVKYKDQFYFMKELPDQFWVGSSKETTAFLQKVIQECNLENIKYALDRKAAAARSPLNFQSLLDYALNQPGGAGVYNRQTGITQVIDLLIERGARIPNSALTTAINNRHAPQTVRLLLERGVIIPKGIILSALSRSHNAETVAVLIKYGATIPQGALTAAIISGYHKETVNLLLQHGASVNEKFPTHSLAATRQGCTPLSAAIAKHNLSMVEHLLQRGADPHLRDASGMNSIHRAIKTEDKKIIELVKNFRRKRSRKN
jgi:hypothetical protein